MFDVIHQWIRLNELHQLMKSFFKILNSFLNFWPKPTIFQKNSEIDPVCLFANFKIVFEILTENRKFCPKTEKYLIDLI